MSKLGVKKLIVCALVAISAIACFTGIGLIANHNQKVDNGQPVFDIGLKYKDGWYLIEDADDYYTMCDNTSVGATPGAKYKLVNDITIDPRKAKSDTFIDATFDGGDYTINNEFDPTYQPDIDTDSTEYTDCWWDYVEQCEYLHYDVTSGGFYNPYEIETPVYGLSVASYLSRHEEGVGLSVVNGKGSEGVSYNGAQVENPTGVWKHDVLNDLSVNARKYTISGIDVNGRYLPQFNLVADNVRDYYPLLNTATFALGIGGVFGVAYNATISNIHVTISEAIIACGFKDNQLCALGGLAGIAYKCKISNCLVQYVGYGDLWESNGTASSTKWKRGGLIGYAKNTTINNCLVLCEGDERIADGKLSGAIIGNYLDEEATDTVTIVNSRRVAKINTSDFTWLTKDGLSYDGYDTSVIATDDGQMCYDLPVDYNSGVYSWVLAYSLFKPTQATSDEEYNTEIGERLDDIYILQPCFIWQVIADSSGGTFSNYNDWEGVDSTRLRKYTLNGDDPLDTLPECVKDGATNIGWKESDGRSVGSDSTFRAIEEGEIFARWNSGGGADTSSFTLTLNLNSTAKNVSFKDRTDDWTAGTKDGIAIMTLSVVEKTYTLTGNEVDTPQLNYPSDVNFTGWYYDQACSTQYTYNAAITSETTLYAGWSPTTNYTVTIKNIKLADATAYKNKLSDWGLTGIEYSKGGDTLKFKYTALSEFRMPGKTSTGDIVRGGCVINRLKIISTANSTWGAVGDTVGFEEGRNGRLIKGRIGNVTIEVEWHDCAVILDLNGGVKSNLYNLETNSSGNYIISYKYDVTLPTASQITKDGYNLSGWEITTTQGNWESVGTTLTVGQEYKNKYGDIVVKAVWEIEPYTITLTTLTTYGRKMLDSLSYSETGVTYRRVSDNKATITYTVDSGQFALPTLSANGYMFQGWTKESSDSGFKDIDNSDAIVGVHEDSVGNATLSAYWECRNYTLIINFGASDATISGYSPSYWAFENIENGGVITGVSFGYTIETTINFPTKTQLTRADYDLTGFTPQNSTGNWGTSEITTSSVSSKYCNNPNETLTLTAQWKVKEYRITLNANGGTISGYSISVAGASFSGSVITYLASSPKFDLPTSVHRTGYTFNGWMLNSGATGTINWVNSGSYKTGVNTGSKGNATLTASWTAIKYNITFELDGDYPPDDMGAEFKAELKNYTLLSTGPYNKTGGSITLTQVYTIEQTVTFPTAEQLTKLGFDLKGFTPNNAGNWGSNTITATSVIGKWGHVTLKVKWSPTPYTVTLVLNGPNSGTSSQIKQYKPFNDEYNKTGGTIEIVYDVTSKFNLPTREQILFTGFTAMEWKLTSIEHDPNNTWGCCAAKSVTKLDDAKISVEYCECNTFATLLNGGTDLSKHSSAELNVDYDVLRAGVDQLNVWLVSKYIDDDSQQWKIFTDEGIRDYETIFRTLSNNFYRFQDASYDYRTSAVVGINKQFSINVSGTDIPDIASLQTVVARLFGFSDVNTFKTHADTLVKTYTEYYKYVESSGTYEALKYDGAVYCDVTNELFVMPFAFKSNLSNTVLSYVVVDSDGDMYIWLNDVNAAIEATNFNNTIQDDISQITIYGRCELFEKPGVGTQFPQGSLIKSKVGNVVLEPVWTENTYNIKLHANNGSNSVTEISGIKYTNQIKITDTTDGTGANERRVVVSGNQNISVALPWELSRDGHIFIGWSTVTSSAEARDMYDSEFFSYTYIDENFTETNLTKAFDKEILQDGKTVSKISEGSYEGVEVVEIYAIWLPIYSLTIEANIPTDVLSKEDAVEGIYYNGSLIASTKIDLTNNYLDEHKLYSQVDSEVFDMPTESGYRLFYYGHYIENWIIDVGGTKYYVEGDKLDAGIDDWKIVVTGLERVKSVTNMQYLQGNIVATPQWKAMKFDVRFETNSIEGYKTGYRDGERSEEDKADVISVVTFNSKYIMSVEKNIAKPAEITVVEARKILGYSTIYTHPYKEGSVDENNTISLTGVWGYRLNYKQYSGALESPGGNNWYIEIEGYYSPDLYRLKLELDLPYTTDNKFKLNNNGFALVDTVELDDLQYKYSSKILLDNDGDGYVEYVNSTNYEYRQNKIYKVENEYYIYLLQDQVIKEKQIFNQYENGKNITDNSGIMLPTFEIAYYQMQYYYTLNDESDVNLYQMAELDDDHKAQAKQKLIDEGANAAGITENLDWKYSYCNTSGEAGSSNHVLNVYWYRNVVNLNVHNLLNNEETFNGYAIIEEVEQVTGTLQEHNKYHLVIYSEYEPEIFGYALYSFDDITKLKQNVVYGTYNYSKFLQDVTGKNDAELTAMGITKTINDATGPSIPIYFGNKFVVQAVDQSKDSSDDLFIGYRFAEYNYSVTNKTGEDKTTPVIAEFDSYVNDGVNYTVEVDLKQYEHDVTDNPDNYFDDKDKLILDVIFEEIKYIFTYQVTDTNDEYTPKYGTIELRDNGNIKENKSQFEYRVTISSCSNLLSKMKVRLGSELVQWKFVKDTLKMPLTELLDPVQSCQIEVNADFLSNYIYTDGNYSSNAEQRAGDINANCQDINFEIRVNVNDISTNTVIRDYILNASESNKLFTIDNSDGNNTYTVSIDNAYTLKMLSKKAEDVCVLYHQGGEKYVIRELYIKHANRHSTNQLVTSFSYPLQSLNDISMMVNNALLDYTINYAQDIEVASDERFLNFYIDVAPTYDIRFEIKKNENDKFNGERNVSITDISIATANNGVELQLVPGYEMYLAYWSQEALFKFDADSTYYLNANLKCDYTTQPDAEFNILANSNIKYSFIDDGVVTIELIPKVYEFDIYIDYQGTHYNVYDEFGDSGELPISELMTANGTQIFNGELSVDVNITDALYRTDDIIKINYELNSTIKDDFEVAIKSNGNTVFYDNEESAYVVKFVDKDILVVITVQAKPETVRLTTNMESYIVADIYAQVNSDEAILVHGVSKPNPVTEINLISGDKLHIYVKNIVGFKFANSYKYGLDTIGVTESEGTGTFDQYTQFTLFESGFELDQNGTYMLLFEQIPIDIQFKYYTYIPSIAEDNNAGQGYTATSQEAIIQKDSVVTLTQGNDTIGYRFDGYTYVAPKSYAGSKEFVLTELNQTQQQFTITDEILSYLSTIEVVENKIPLVVYVNYVKQYTYEIEYKCNVAQVSANITNNATGDVMSQYVYYDYGTPLNIAIKTADTKHYKLDVVLTKSGTDEEINTSTISSVDVVAGSVIQTNLDNLAGFTAIRELTDHYVITIDIVVEKYDTKLNQYLNNGNAGIDEQSSSLQAKGDTLFNLADNVYYKVSDTVTHEYESAVEISIYVLKPQNTESQYYTLSEVKLNGITLNVQLTGETELEGKASYVYTFEYVLQGDELPTEQALDIYFNAIYYVSMGIG